MKCASAEYAGAHFLLLAAHQARDLTWFFFFQAEDGIRDVAVTGVQTCALPIFDETHDEKKSQGWTALILDTNGNGKRDEYVEPDQPVDRNKDKRINAAFYGVTVSPVDGSIWGTVLGFPGAVVRLNPGSNPPATSLAEIYELPWNSPNAPVRGFSPRGLDIDRNGVVWAVIASGHLASFDRRKCKGPLNGPTATGQHCPEGWTLHPLPGPQDRKSTRLNSSHGYISYAVFCLKKKNNQHYHTSKSSPYRHSTPPHRIRTLNLFPSPTNRSYISHILYCSTSLQVLLHQQHQYCL